MSELERWGGGSPARRNRKEAAEARVRAQRILHGYQMTRYAMHLSGSLHEYAADNAMSPSHARSLQTYINNFDNCAVTNIAHYMLRP